MSFKNFARAFGQVLVVAAQASVAAQAEQTGQRQAYSAENAEAAKWDQRRQEAFDNIELALKNDQSMKRISGLTTKQEKAIELKADATKHCRDRSESMMSHVERRITALQTSWF